MKKPLSYLWPLTKKVKSNFNGDLEITWLDGKKLLNSKNANYSYGSLEKVLDYGLSFSKAERSSNVLLLGLGGGSVLGLLRKKYKYSGRITAVEIDSAVIDIAVNEFDIKKYEPLELLCKDAFKYVQETTGHYGLIIIDLFIDLEVARKSFSAEFWSAISRLLHKNGEVIFNSGINSANLEETIQIQEEVKSMDFKLFENVFGTNTLLIGRKK